MLSQGFLDGGVKVKVGEGKADGILLALKKGATRQGTQAVSQHLEVLRELLSLHKEPGGARSCEMKKLSCLHLLGTLERKLLRCLDQLG